MGICHLRRRGGVGEGGKGISLLGWGLKGRGSSLTGLYRGLYRGVL